MARGIEQVTYCPVSDLYVVLAHGTAACPECGQFQHYVGTGVA